MRDIGHPMVKVNYLPATPELVAKTRADLQHAVEMIESRLNGCPTKVTINFGEKPEHYGEPQDWHPGDCSGSWRDCLNKK